jgi:hypothetical protein
MIHQDIVWKNVDDLTLDPKNPRLGRSNVQRVLTQPAIMDFMRDWDLEELAVSFLESRFWVQEALLVTEEILYGQHALVVIEGNRRLAALKQLQAAANGKATSPTWKALVRGRKIPGGLFTKVPCLMADKRADIDAFLGFRHVTGIKQWRPAEKAEYISRLIDGGLSYEQVKEMMGSKAPTVRQNYISYHLLLQMEDMEEIAVEDVEVKFSVLYLALRSAGVQKYLNIDIEAGPRAVRKPVPRTHLKALANFALWLFGNKEKDVKPLISDSRKVDEFGSILESAEAVEYLERSEIPNYDVALNLAGGEEPELVRLIERAADNVELALGKVFRYKGSAKLDKAVGRLQDDMDQLRLVFGRNDKPTPKRQK